VDEDGVDAEALACGQGFSRDLEEDSFVHVRTKYRMRAWKALCLWEILVSAGFFIETASSSSSGVPVPSGVFGHKILDFNGLQRVSICKNIHNKSAAAKILLINELAPGGVRGLLVFDLSIDSGLNVSKMPRGFCWLIKG
jgi:hypothetical protein